MTNVLFKKIFIIIFSFIGSATLFTACDSDTSSTSAFTGVRVIDNTYSPPVVRINEGGKVRFNNWVTILITL